MNIWQKGTLNYATVEVDSHLYDVHFRYFGEDSYFVEQVFELPVLEVGQEYNILPELDAFFIDRIVEQLMILERE